MFLAQLKINLQSFKSTPDSLKQRFKAFGRKPSLGDPELLSPEMPARMIDGWEKCSCSLTTVYKMLLQGALRKYIVVGSYSSLPFNVIFEGRRRGGKKLVR